MAEKTDVVVIGAGQAGLAISNVLTRLNVDHVVLDRGAIGDRWRSERWASLRLLTPNWMTRLPGFSYDGNDPHGFMHKDELVSYLGRYARSFRAPVISGADVQSVTKAGAGFRVRIKDRTDFVARAVIIATGACDAPNIPAMSESLPKSIRQVKTTEYLHPGDLPEGNVLVVGASATGVQLAQEIHESGRPVTLAVGTHVWMPRRYRGHDITYWMDAAGLLSERRDPAIAPERAMRIPSPQLVGSSSNRDVGLATLSGLGVRIQGRFQGTSGGVAKFAATLGDEIAKAKDRSDKLLGRIDDYIEKAGLRAPGGQGTGRGIFDVKLPQSNEIDLAAENIRTVVWATGYRRTYPWMKLPALQSDGELDHAGGVLKVPGIFALGLPFMRRRNSTFIDGVGGDAEAIGTRVWERLNAISRKAA